MTYKIINNLISGLPKEPYRKGVGAYEGVVAHATAVNNVADERQVEAFKNNWRTFGAFVQYFVDWDSIRQTASIDYKAWGAGSKANPRYVHVELCETSDPKKFAESYKRYVWLLAWVLKRKNLGVTDTKTLLSHDWISRNMGGTTHTDPIGYLKKHGKTWADLVKDVKTEYAAMSTPTAQKAEVETVKPVVYATHKVKSGESLGKIAAKYGVKTAALATLNKIKDPDFIQVGQVLKIPSLIHVVQPGDVLGKIAAANGTTAAALKKINNLIDVDKIYVGQRLKLR